MKEDYPTLSALPVGVIYRVKAYVDHTENEASYPFPLVTLELDKAENEKEQTVVTGLATEIVCWCAETHDGDPESHLFQSIGTYVAAIENGIKVCLFRRAESGVVETLLPADTMDHLSTQEGASDHTPHGHAA